MVVSVCVYLALDIEDLLLYAQVVSLIDEWEDDRKQLKTGSSLEKRKRAERDSLRKYCETYSGDGQIDPKKTNELADITKEVPVKHSPARAKLRDSLACPKFMVAAGVCTGHGFARKTENKGPGFGGQFEVDCYNRVDFASIVSKISDWTGNPV